MSGPRDVAFVMRRTTVLVRGTDVSRIFSLMIHGAGGTSFGKVTVSPTVRGAALPPVTVTVAVAVTA